MNKALLCIGILVALAASAAAQTTPAPARELRKLQPGQTAAEYEREIKEWAESEHMRYDPPEAQLMQRPFLRGGEWEPGGMVWVANRNVWELREQGGCAWCAPPMSFKQAAFDKKMLWFQFGAWGATIADVEYAHSKACVQNGTCTEGNPILRSTDRKVQYGVRLPTLFLAWMGEAYIRKGDTRLNVGGWKWWKILPWLYTGASTTSLIVNAAR
jgi:hypothetical protein